MATGITAVVLSVGEPTLESALECLRQQRLPVDDIILIENVSPFHVAFNEGARRVATPYFVQVDADMLLDPDCTATLWSDMGSDVGLSVGLLRDALVGEVIGVKLHRTECVRQVALQNSISPDTDFVDAIAMHGWKTIFAGKMRFGNGAQRTLGEHRPDYSARYTYRKYLMEGERYRYRGAIGGMRSHLRNLEQSAHPSAPIARIAMARGFFKTSNADLLGRGAGDDEYGIVAAFLAGSDGAISPPDMPPLSMKIGDPQESFRSWFLRGRTDFATRAAQRFLSDMAELAAAPPDGNRWMQLFALCQGLLSTADEESEQAWSTCAPFAVDRGRSEPLNMPTRDEMLADFADYARDNRISRFTSVGTISGEFERTGETSLRPTGRTVEVWYDKRGRERLRLPFRLSGHLIAPDADRASSFYWLLDVLRSGHTSLHLPTAFGGYRLSVPGELIRSILQRVGIVRLRDEHSLDGALSIIVAHRPPDYIPVDKRVLMVTENVGRGGSERQLVAATKGLVERGYDVRVLLFEELPPEAPSYLAELRSLGVQISYGSQSVGREPPRMKAMLPSVDTQAASALPPWLLGRIVDVAKVMTSERPEIVHAWLNGPGVAAALAAAAVGAPRTIIQQGSLALSRRGHPQAPVMRAAYRAVASDPRVVIVNNSAAGARDNERWADLPTASIGVILNGFDLSSARRAAPDAIKQERKRLGIGTDRFVVGTVARFVPEKDMDLWVRTAAAIAARCAEVHFLIYGYGPLREALEAQIRESGLAAVTTLAGPTDEVGLAFSAMDVMLMTSKVEGLPNTLIEAQAVGCPVVTTNAGGAGEALQDGITGTLVASRDPTDLAAAVVCYRDDPELAARARSAGPPFIASTFSFDKMIETTIAYYVDGRSERA